MINFRPHFIELHILNKDLKACACERFKMYQLEPFKETDESVNLTFRNCVMLSNF